VERRERSVVKKLPDKLFQMTNQGVDEAIIQYIFDAIIEAEGRGVRYLNVYDYEAKEPGFLFTNNEREAADQFARAVKAGKRSLAFINNGETWDEG
jgi:hypothetical protein